MVFSKRTGKVQRALKRKTPLHRLKSSRQLQKSELFPSSFCWHRGHGATALEKSCWASFVTLQFLLYLSFAEAHRRAELLGSCTACFVLTILPSDPFTNKAFSKHVFKQCLSCCWSPWLGSWRVWVGTIPFWAVALQNHSGCWWSCSRTKDCTWAWVLCFELRLNWRTPNLRQPLLGISWPANRS